MARAPKKAPSNKLIQQIRSVAARISYVPDKRGDLNRLARELDAKGIKSMEGGSWILRREGKGDSAQKLSILLRDHIPELHAGGATQKQPAVTLAPEPPVEGEIPDKVSPETEEPVSAAASEEPGALQSPAATDDVTPLEHKATQFDEATTQVLLEVAEWWKHGRPKEGAAMGEAPKFRRLHKDETITRSIRLPAKLLKLAETQAKKQRARTGGNLNSLIVLLLWEFCGKPAGFVEETNGE